MTATLRDAVVGAWELVSFLARDTRTGEQRHPLGTAPHHLTLSAIMTDDAGATTHSTLVWRPRVPARRRRSQV